MLDTDPVVAAKYHCDKHVGKMILETAQILSTVNYLHEQSAPYKPTHVNHGAIEWAGKSRENYNWLLTLGASLAGEFFLRFEKTHKSYYALSSISTQANHPPGS